MEGKNGGWNWAEAMQEGLFTAGGVVQGRGGSPQTAGTTEPPTALIRVE